MPDPVQNPSVPTPPPSLAQQSTAPAPPQVQNPAGVPDQIPNPPPQLQNMQQLPKQYQPTVPTGGGHWHQAVQALLGTSTQYRPSDPNNPNSPPVPYQVQNKPGNLFRSIRAGAILGAGAGTANAEHNAGSGWGAAGAGAAAAQKNAQMQQQQRQQQAQQQFENQRQVSQDQQAEILRKAQIAQANTETLRMNKEIQGMDYDQHQKMAAFGKASIQPYVDANIKPVAEGVSESQQQQYPIDHPESVAWDWEPTGVKLTTTKDAEGNEIPHYEATYSAYDPKGKVTVPDSTLQEWNKEGIFDRFPEYKHVLSDKTLPVSAYIEVKRTADGVYADNLAKQKDQLELKKDQAAIDADNARRSESLTNQRKINQEISEAALGKTQTEQFNKALDELNKANGNFDAMKPSSRVIIAESMNKMVPALTSLYKEAITADPSDSQGKAADLLSQIQNVSSLGTRALSSLSGNGAVAHPDVLKILNGIPGFDPQIAEKVANLSPDEIASQVQSSKLPDNVKNQILKSIGKPPVAGPKPLLVPNAAGRAVGNAVEQAAPIVGQAISSIPQL